MDRLLTLLRRELGAYYNILEEQPRNADDAKLKDYLANNLERRLNDDMTEPTAS